MNCSFFAARQRTNQESAPRLSPLDPPGIAALQREPRDKQKSCAVLQIQLTRAAGAESKKVFVFRLA
jgi:hypothetical protein